MNLRVGDQPGTRCVNYEKGVLLADSHGILYEW